jgi:DNA-binding response OmpR family regulator
MKRRILLVDDELPILLTLKAILEINGFEVDSAGSGREAEEKLKSCDYHMVITDMRMEHDKAGYDVIRAARKAKCNPAVAILTAYPVSGEDSKEQSADSVLVKPMNTNELLRQIEVLLVAHADKKHARAVATSARATKRTPKGTVAAS